MPSRGSSPEAPAPAAPAPSSRRRVLRHDALISLRGVLPLLLLGLVVFCVLLPVSTAGVPKTSIFNLAYTHDQLRFRFFSEELTLTLTLAVVGYGICMGLALFRFALARRETAVYFSLGLSRTALFITRYLVGVVVLAVAVVVPLLVSLLLNVIALGVTPGVIGHCVYVGAGLVVLGLVAMTVTVVCLLVSGTLVEALSFSVAALASVTVAAWGLNALMDHLLVGNAFGETTYSGTTRVADSLLALTAPFNPVLFFLDPVDAASRFSRSGTMMEPAAVDWLLPAVWLFVAAALAAAGVMLIRRRRSEFAGIAGAAPGMEAVAAAVLGFAAFTAVVRLLAAASVGFALAAALAALAVVALALYRMRRRSRWTVRQAVVVAAVPVVAAVVVAAVITAGGLGYAGRIPAAGDVVSVDVSYVGSPSLLAAPAAATSVGRGYYFAAVYSYGDTADIELVTRVQRRLVATARSPFAARSDDFSATVVPYDVLLTYHLRDGGLVTRYYDRCTLAELRELAKLDDSRRTRALVRAVVSGDTSRAEDDAARVAASSAWAAYRAGDIYIADRWYSDPMRVTCSARKREELLSAVAADLAAQPASARYAPPSAALGVLMFTLEGERDAASFAYGVGNTLVYVTPDMTRTARFLAANDLDDAMTFHGRVESLAFQKYDPYAGISEVTQPSSHYFLGYRSDSDDYFWTQEDFGLRLTINDQERIDRLLPALRNTWFMSDGGYLVAARLAGTSTYAYCYLPADEAPDDIRQRVL